MRYLSVCSGIEAASVAWHHLGWYPVAFSEIEPFPAAVLAHHYPNVPNYGDMTKHKEWPLGPGSIDLLVGGTPCQAFSVAGLRRGLSDPRGGLMLTYLEIAQRLRPRWLVWENVPGVLSSGGGRDFGSFLGALGELGYGWAYRVLDAQWVRTQRHPRAVPQRRRRVFVVGCLGDWKRAAQVLFERESVQRDSAPRRAQGEGSAADAEGCAATVSSKWAKGTGGPAGDECYNLTTQPIAGTIGNRGLRSHTELDGHGAYIPVQQPVPYDLFQITAPVNRQNRRPGDPCHTLARDNAAHAAVAFTPGNLARGAGPSPNAEVAPTQRCSAGRGADDQRTCVAMVGTDLYNGAITGDVAATMGTPGSSVNASGPTAMAFKPGQSAEARSLGAQVDVACTLEAGGGGNNKQAVAFQACGDRDNPSISVSDTAFCLPANAMSDRGQAVAFDWQSGGDSRGLDPKDTAQLQRCQTPAVHQAMTVRRLTPTECSRLQGFPDDWTLIPWRGKPAEQCPDGPRYKALGNSMAVNVVTWIGERIQAIDAQTRLQPAPTLDNGGGCDVAPPL